MIKTRCIEIKDAFTIYFVGSEQDAVAIDLYVKCHEEVLDLQELTNWLLKRRIFAGATECRKKPRFLLDCHFFNRTMKKQGLYIDVDDYMEGMFLEQPQAVTNTFGVSIKELSDGLKNTTWIEKYNVTSLQQIEKEKDIESC